MSKFVVLSFFGVTTLPCGLEFAFNYQIGSMIYRVEFLKVFLWVFQVLLQELWWVKQLSEVFQKLAEYATTNDVQNEGTRYPLALHSQILSSTKDMKTWQKREKSKGGTLGCFFNFFEKFLTELLA